MGRASTPLEQQSDFVTDAVGKVCLLVTIIGKITHRLVDGVPLLLSEQLTVDLDGQIGSHENLGEQI